MSRSPGRPPDEGIAIDTQNQDEDFPNAGDTPAASPNLRRKRRVRRRKTPPANASIEDEPAEERVEDDEQYFLRSSEQPPLASTSSTEPSSFPSNQTSEPSQAPQSSSVTPRKKTKKKKVKSVAIESEDGGESVPLTPSHSPPSVPPSQRFRAPSQASIRLTSVPGLTSTSVPELEEADVVDGDAAGAGATEFPSDPSFNVVATPVRDRIFIEQPESGKFKKVPKEKVLMKQREDAKQQQQQEAEAQRLLNDTDEVTEQRRTMDIIAEAGATTQVFLQGIFTGMSVYQIFINFQNFSSSKWTSFLACYSVIGRDVAIFNLIIVTICFIGVCDKYAKDSMADWFQRRYQRTRDIAIIILYLLCLCLAIVNVPMTDSLYYANQRVPGWWLSQPIGGSFETNLTIFVALSTTQACLAIIAWFVVALETRMYAVNLSNRVLYLYHMNPEILESLINSSGPILRAPTGSTQTAQRVTLGPAPSPGRI